MDNTRDELLPSLYGTRIKRSKACAYCHYHKCHLTVTMLKKHECLKKQCSHLKKHDNNPYWEQRAMIKAKRSAKKQTAN